ncbi:helix-turn-helix domain-containing protein [Burkholderia cepacia]|uniref:helix-turn-helix domain-containing protein n=1 Tax=Burkholderia cepacia TaxID=292 RepID=UPI000A8CBF79|nr:helix-turn-helix domain-containing protein [Burkholderia cepacia]
MDAIPCKSLGSYQPVPKRWNQRDDRRLADDGTSYREILESVRHALAVERVKAGKLGLQEIAFLLGYDSLGNFRRALIRWEGMSPSEFRWAEPRS